MFRSTAVALLGGFVATSWQSQAPVLDIPRVTSGRVVIDGRIDPSEWSGAIVRDAGAGMTLRLQHDGRHLYLSVTGPVFGFNSLCLTRGDSVRVLHASAALGAVTYTRGASEWTSRDTAFSYGMRSTDTTADARAQRTAFLESHGWVASTVRMGGGLAQEFQIALTHLDPEPRFAFSRFIPNTGSNPDIAPWPPSLDHDGCTVMRLVSGYVPSPLRFSPDRWTTLRLIGR